MLNQHGNHNLWFSIQHHIMVCGAFNGVFPTLFYILWGLTFISLTKFLKDLTLQAIKIFFWLNLQWISVHHWPFSSALLFLPLLSLCSVRRPAGLADSVGFLMGSHGLNALIMSSAKQVRRGVWLHDLSHHAAPNPAVVLLPLSKLYTAPHTVIYWRLSVLKPWQHWCSLSELYDKLRNVNFIACASRWVNVWCARTAGYTADCGK